MLVSWILLVALGIYMHSTGIKQGVHTDANKSKRTYVRNSRAWDTSNIKSFAITQRQSKGKQPSPHQFSTRQFCLWPFSQNFLFSWKLKWNSIFNDSSFISEKSEKLKRWFVILDSVNNRNDSDRCGSVSKPCYHLQSALNQMEDGDTIVLTSKTGKGDVFVQLSVLPNWSIIQVLTFGFFVFLKKMTFGFCLFVFFKKNFSHFLPLEVIQGFAQHQICCSIVLASNKHHNSFFQIWKQLLY